MPRRLLRETEVRVLSMVAEGGTEEDAAAALGVGLAVVDRRVQRACARLGVGTVDEAVRAAVALGELSDVE
jgi:DNA-binding CsgD family transcriptional regulator